MDNRPIGIFDSGLGGLTAVRQIMDIMPGEDLVYFGDTGRVPYGSKSRETIIRYTKDDIEFLLKHDIKIIIAACGTASSVALPELYGKYDIKIIGVLEPACEEAVRVSKNGRIGVIGTSGTIKSGKYTEHIKNINPKLTVISNACPMFVPIVENGYSKSTVARIIAEEYLMPLKKENVDTIILGCTHYPLLEDIISDIMGDGVKLINPGALAAKRAEEYLKEKDCLSVKDSGGKRTFFVSDSVENFAELGSTFLGIDIEGSVYKTEVTPE